MANCRNTEHCIFSNGAGKAFIAELLKLSATVGETWLPKLSTTTDPRTDWCGLPNPRHGITGVADVILETIQGEKLLVAEVKGEARTSKVVGEFQLLAELRTIQHCSPKRPVFGLLVNPVKISLYMPVPGRLRRLTDQYEVLSRCTNSLAAVIELMSITFGLIKQSIAEHQAATVGASPSQLPLPAPAEPRTGTPTLEEREEGAEVQLPLPAPAESMTGTPTLEEREERAEAQLLLPSPAESMLTLEERVTAVEGTLERFGSMEGTLQRIEGMLLAHVHGGNN